MRHALTIDVEDYYMSPPSIRPEDWERFPDRLHYTLPRLLEWLAEHEQEATFFVLGAIAAKNGALIRRISDAGHEVAIHGWNHRSLKVLGPVQFAHDLHRARDVVQAATGRQVLGFRAAAFSLDARTPWAYDILLDEGFRYDASSAPYYGWLYGEPFAPVAVHQRRAPSGRWLLEIPLTALGPRPFRVPVPGGFFLRLYPYGLTRCLFRACERRHRTIVTYLHPWEVDERSPRLPVALVQRLIYFTGMKNSPAKIKRLLSDFRFAAIRSLLADGTLASLSATSPAPLA